MTSNDSPQRGTGGRQAGTPNGRVADTTCLAVAEAAELTACEQVIERGITTFIEVGEALLRIRDGRLYRATHGTFAAYCRDRWGFGRAHAYRMIAAAEVVSPIGDTGLPMPANEAQARELAPLKDNPAALLGAWRQATRDTGKPHPGMLRRIVRAARQQIELQTSICTGCAICERGPIICHYRPRGRPPRGAARYVHIDGHGVAYDDYITPAQLAEKRELFEADDPAGTWEEWRLPKGELVYERRQPVTPCGLDGCVACSQCAYQVAVPGSAS